jgi:hypothetical protein
MARIRTIKPEFQQSGSMGRVSRDARLLFILLWPMCDDAGRTRADPKMLAGALFPYDDDAREMIVEWLFELERQESIQLYQVNDDAYLQIVKWDDHQKIDHPSRSKFPSPPAKKRKKSTVVPREASRESREDSCGPRAGPRTKEGTKDQGPDSRALRDEFEKQFWPICPRKVGKPVALKAFVKARKTTSLETLVTAMRAYAASRSGEDEQYTAHPKTWLSQGRWGDELTKPNGHDPPAGISADRLAAIQQLEEETRRKNAENANQLH